MEVKPSRYPTMRNSGRRVARLPAVMARPCSVVDQIAISTVASAGARVSTLTNLNFDRGIPRSRVKEEESGTYTRNQCF